MKKLTTLTILCILAGIFFSACNTSLSLTKRRYNKGYYIAHGHSKAKQTSLTPKKEVEIVNKEIAMPVYSLQAMPEENVTDAQIAKKTKTDNDALTASNEIKHRTKTHQNNILAIKYKPKTIINESGQIKRSAFESKKTAIAPVRDAFSLLWIIIVIILILWLIGLLAGGWGLGGFINLLLLVAIILLILWLLRIV